MTAPVHFTSITIPEDSSEGQWAAISVVSHGASSRTHHPQEGNQLERGRRCFTIELKALLSVHDGLWPGWEIRGNTDSPAALWTHYLLYTMENTSSNQRGAVGLLIDGLCVCGEAERGEGRGERQQEREREFVTDVQPFERKLNKYLISKRWAAPVRRVLSQAF